MFSSVTPSQSFSLTLPSRSITTSVDRASLCWSNAARRAPKLAFAALLFGYQVFVIQRQLQQLPLSLYTLTSFRFVFHTLRFPGLVLNRQQEWFLAMAACRETARSILWCAPTSWDNMELWLAEDEAGQRELSMASLSRIACTCHQSAVDTGRADNRHGTLNAFLSFSFPRRCSLLWIIKMLDLW